MSAAQPAPGLPVGHSDRTEEFVYRIAHDLRSSSRAIRELPQWITEDLSEIGVDLPDHVQDATRLLQDHARRMDKILDSLLTYAQIASYPVAPCPIRETLRAAVSRVPLRPDVRLRIRLPDRLVLAVREELELLFVELLTNALCHNPDLGKIWVLGRAEGDHLTFDVIDDGGGISRSHWDAALQPMVKIHSNDGHNGPGMGLALVARIAESCHGQAHIAPLPKGRTGTRVAVTLPLA